MRDKQNGRKTYILFLLIISFVFLTIYAKYSGENEQIQEIEPLPTTRRPPPDFAPTSLLTGYYPFNLDNVSCRDNLYTVEDFDHWADALIPGVSTVDDLLSLRDITEKFQPARTGDDKIYTGGVVLWFNDGILYTKSGPRTKLGEILAHYGPPEKVIWETPSYHNDHPAEGTYLIYPEHKAIFFGSKTVMFWANTEFHSLFYSTQEEFIAITSVNFTTNKFEQYIESAWPCGE